MFVLIRLTCSCCIELNLGIIRGLNFGKYVHDKFYIRISRILFTLLQHSNLGLWFVEIGTRGRNHLQVSSLLCFFRHFLGIALQLFELRCLAEDH